MAEPYIKYAENSEYSGNCPYLRANKAIFWQKASQLPEGTAITKEIAADIVKGKPIKEIIDGLQKEETPKMVNNN